MESVQIVGILNVTPDSYYDGGKFFSLEQAIERAHQMVEDGADIIEIGGESTGPNSRDVSIEEESNRVLPVIKELRRMFPAMRLSIDTYKSALAQAAIEYGVDLVNDVTAGRSDPRMFSMIAESSASLVLMYSKDSSPRTSITETQYEDVIQTITTFLTERTNTAIEAGISKYRLILDPGLGHFVSSDPKYSFEIIARLREFQALGFPLFLSPSRKSFLAGSENLPTAERLPGTIAASSIAVLHGAVFIRTHDVKEVRLACEIAEGIRSRI